MGLYAILDQVVTALAVVPGLTAEVGQKKVAGHGKPRRIVFIPQVATTGQAVKEEGITIVEDALDWPVDVHCWGANAAEAERLVACAVTAAKQVTKKGARLRTVRPSEDAESSHMANGYLLVAELVFGVPLMRQDLAAFADFEHQTVLITSASFDPDNSPDPDPEDGD